MVGIIDIIRYEIKQKSIEIALTKTKARSSSEGHISPKHEDWGRYRRQKREASILLTALRMLRWGPGARPGKPAAHGGACHAANGKAARIISAHARKLLRKIGNRLEKSSKNRTAPWAARFAAAEKHASERREFLANMASKAADQAQQEMDKIRFRTSSAAERQQQEQDSKNVGEFLSAFGQEA